uniref:Uncharacterized protein n=1 Tax=Physcomitrium patens TaxID=3218 RepID=A0A2K1JL35_PHYPA|nr:hypothetical protein PHYPA_017058 [Physcomitrium patens]
MVTPVVGRPSRRWSSARPSSPPVSTIRATMLRIRRLNHASLDVILSWKIEPSWYG